MTIEVRQLTIRSTVHDPARPGAASMQAAGLDTEEAAERLKREIIADLKAWLDSRQRRQGER